MGPSALCVTPVRSRKDRIAFRRLPFDLYRDDPHWVPPLNRDIAGFLNLRQHPFYDDGEAGFFVARRGPRTVGRIAAIRNGAHNRYHDDRTGFFGFYEATDDQEVAGALLDAATEWLRGHDLSSIRGPFSPSTNYVSGLLVGGEPGPPAFMMPHNPLHYGDQLEAWGLTKAMDLLAFDLNQEAITAKRWTRVSRRVSNRVGCTMRPLDLSRFKEEVRTMIDVYHDAWADNWGFVPMSPGEVSHMAAEMRPVIHPNYCAFIMKDGQEIGFYLGLPDYNQVLIHLQGRLFPFGIVRLLRARKRLDRLRLLLMGVRREFQSLGLDALLYEHAFTTGLEKGVFSCEASWILETNSSMVNAMERGGARQIRRYRIYEKPL